MSSHTGVAAFSLGLLFWGFIAYAISSWTISNRTSYKIIKTAVVPLLVLGSIGIIVFEFIRR